MGTAIGIDLGTSNSCVAAVRNDAPVVLADDQGRRTQPSVVAFGYGQSVVVGHRAKPQLAFAPENTLHSVKRLIGRRFNSPEVDRLRAHVAWGIAEGPLGDARIRVQGRVHTAQEISAHILRHMKKVAENALGETVSQAVITVPAYFNDQQRQATRDAATIAGLECLRILNEPTAAALSYGLGQGKSQHVAVYDLGGGTFDISILRIEDDVFEVVSTAGDTFLGGDDIDMAIVEQLYALLNHSAGMELEYDQTARARLREAAERGKIALSDAPVVEIRVPNVVKARGQPISLHTRMDRHLLRRVATPFLQRTIEVCRDALAQAGLSLAQIDHVLLVGGMTRSPAVREAVMGFFEMEPVGSLNPDEVVALGAALQASMLTAAAEGAGSVLLDVTSQTLGVRTVGGFVEPLIPRNTGIPTEISRVFHTANDHQTEVRIQVYQGESRQARENDLLGEFVLADLPPGPRGSVKIKVTFTIDADGIVHAAALDQATGRGRGIRIDRGSRLTQEEVLSLRMDELQAASG